LSTRLLIDSHVFIWLTEGAGRLSAEAAEVMVHPDTEIFVSAVSVAEICIKNALGKLPLPAAIEADPKAGFPAAFERMGLSELNLTLAHAARLRVLPRHHGDPFDRLLIAQALEDRLTLVTHDRTFGLYGDLKLLWT
jgi:PIN domain nuclease of toxin-antitoxin system